MSRRGVRAPATALLAVTLIALAAPAAAQAGFGVEKFEAGTCSKEKTTEHPCTYASVEADHAEAFTPAAGHPPYAVTTFEFNSSGGKPEGEVKRVRVDLPHGFAANPQAVEQCPVATFEASECATKYAGSLVGTDELTLYLLGVDESITADVYDLSQPAGLPLDFGIEVPLIEHLFLEGHVSWASDYHEYFEINNISKTIPIVKSELIFKGTAGVHGGFLTLPSECSATTTSDLEVESYEGEVKHAETHTPLGVEDCELAPFAPTATVSAGAGEAGPGAPDGSTTSVDVPQHTESTNSADVRNVKLTLPEGLTLNPSAASGLGVCTEAEIAIGSSSPVTCPADSKVGTVTIETDLPAGSLTGNAYLGSPSGAAITGPPYTLYLDAESVYGVSVRLRGTVTPNPSTGRLSVSFEDNPRLPFSSLALHLDGGARAPLANPLSCATGAVEGAFAPYTGLAEAFSSTAFAASGCASPLPFTPSQSTAESSSVAGAYTGYSLTLSRGEAQQYLSEVHVVLPEGLVGAIPSVSTCPEAQAATDSCPAASEIGTASAEAGAGPEPYDFTGGSAYLTGPYDGAPYGLLVEVPAVAGPFNLGEVPARFALNVDPNSSRVIVSGTLPSIVGGIPLRLRSVSVDVNRANFLFNPTNCGALATESTLTGAVPGSAESTSATVSSPLSVSDCAALAFKPKLTARTSAKTSKADGASLETTIEQPAHEANIKEVAVTLPAQLVSRLTTLQKACPEATFAADPLDCPADSKVGGARAYTPVLAGMLSGPAYLVSHGGAAFPDLDLVLEGDGVRVILTGNTQIKGGITTTTFADVPDVPVSSVTVNLPLGPHSALAPNGSLCSAPLVLPTTIIAQNGAKVSQNTSATVSGCGVKILRHRVLGDRLRLTVETSTAGRVSATGAGLQVVYRKLAAARTAVVIEVPLSQAGLRRRRPLHLQVRVGFLPRHRGLASSTAYAGVTFR